MPQAHFTVYLYASSVGVYSVCFITWAVVGLIDEQADVKHHVFLYVDTKLSKTNLN